MCKQMLAFRFSLLLKNQREHNGLLLLQHSLNICCYYVYMINLGAYQLWKDIPLSPLVRIINTGKKHDFTMT